MSGRLTLVIVETMLRLLAAFSRPGVPVLLRGTLANFLAYLREIPVPVQGGDCAATLPARQITCLREPRPRPDFPPLRRAPDAARPAKNSERSPLRRSRLDGVTNSPLSRSYVGGNNY
jgi:hypothetical protein